MNQLRPWSVYLAIGLISIGTGVWVWAAPNSDQSQTIPYQATLEKDGEPLSGQVDITFHLYNARDEGSGTLLWSETQQVTLHNGAFSVLLGSVTPLDSKVWSAQRLFVAMDIDGVPMFGRQQIGGVPYAWRGVPGSDFLLGRGLLPASLTSAEISSITNPADGLIVYDRQDSVLLRFDAVQAAWREVGAPPIGTIMAWHRDLAGTPNLPYGWAE